MKIKIILLGVGIILKSGSLCAQFNPDSVFIRWNKKTFQSLDRQLESTKDEKQKKLILNRVLALKMSLKVNDEKRVSNKSTRYGFLKILQTRYQTKQALFVMEADESGYMVTIRNIVFYTDANYNAKVDFYDFNDGKWVFRGRGNVKNVFIQKDLQAYMTGVWKGFNQDDVIVTKFDYKTEPIESEYFLPYTLLKASCFESIIKAKSR